MLRINYNSGGSEGCIRDMLGPLLALLWPI